VAFTFHAFHPKAECCLADVAGLLARPSVEHLPVRHAQQWYEDSTMARDEKSVIPYPDLQLRG